MSRFSVEQLRTFACVMEYGTFEAAADILQVSPSAVSQRIKAMEQAAGRILVKRTNPVAPTETGQLVLRVARQQAYLSQELEDQLGFGGAEQTIAIAVNADSLATWFLDAVAVLAKEDRIFCDLRRAGEQYSSALLRTGQAMAAITANPEPIAGCRVQKLAVENYWVVCSRDYAHYYFQDWPGRITLEELNAAPVIEYDRQDVGQDLARSLILKKFFLDDHKAGAAPSIYVPSSPDYARAVELGVGWGIVPQQQCQEGLNKARLVKLADEPVQIPLYWQRWRIASEVLDRVTSRVYEALDNSRQKQS